MYSADKEWLGCCRGGECSDVTFAGIGDSVYCFLKKSFLVSVFLPVIILCICAKSLMVSSSDELW